MNADGPGGAAAARFTGCGLRYDDKAPHASRRRIRVHLCASVFICVESFLLCNQPLRRDGKCGNHRGTRRFAWPVIQGLAERFRRTVYDAVYLELAHRKRLKLASLDQDLRQAGAALGVALLASEAP